MEWKRDHKGALWIGALVVVVSVYGLWQTSRTEAGRKRRQEKQVQEAISQCTAQLERNRWRKHESRNELTKLSTEVEKESDPRVQRAKRAVLETFSKRMKQIELEREMDAKVAFAHALWASGGTGFDHEKMFDEIELRVERR